MVLGYTLAAIDRFAAVLADPAKPEADRREALIFLVHLIGDLHKPMHVTTNNDRGGNDTLVTFFGRPTNLHAVWDIGLMEQTGLTITAWTDALNRAGLSVPPGGTPTHWALEAARVAGDHCYAIPADHALGQADVAANLPVLRQQLYGGGVRLAASLNGIFERAATRRTP